MCISETGAYGGIEVIGELESCWSLMEDTIDAGKFDERKPLFYSAFDVLKAVPLVQ